MCVSGLAEVRSLKYENDNRKAHPIINAQEPYVEKVPAYEDQRSPIKTQ